MKYDKSLIGQKFYKKTGKGEKYVATVVDIFRTYDENEKLVSVVYKYEYDFLGQKMKGFCPHTTIVLNKIS
jgi:hypothetical protein